MRTISKLFDSHAEAARVAGDLVAVGVPRVQIAIIGPYQDEIGILRSPCVILGAVGAMLAGLSAMIAYGGLSATALICAVCGGGGGGLLGACIAAATKLDDRSSAERIVLVTAHVDDHETDIAQAVLGGCAPTAFIAEAA